MEASTSFSVGSTLVVCTRRGFFIGGSNLAPVIPHVIFRGRGSMRWSAGGNPGIKEKGGEVLGLSRANTYPRSNLFLYPLPGNPSRHSLPSRSQEKLLKFKTTLTAQPPCLRLVFF